MLALGIRAQHTFISKSLLNDLEGIITDESATAMRFFDEKFVTNQSCEMITKVNWEIDDEQLVIPLQTSLITR